MHTSDGAELTVVNDDDKAAAIRARRVRLRIKSPQAAADKSKLMGFDISVDAIKNAEGVGKNKGSDVTYERLDAFYDAVEEEIGPVEESLSGETVTFTVSGNFGVSATVQGPVTIFAELEEAAAHLMREAMRPPDPPE